MFRESAPTRHKYTRHKPAATCALTHSTPSLTLHQRMSPEHAPVPPRPREVPSAMMIVDPPHTFCLNPCILSVSREHPTGPPTWLCTIPSHFAPPILSYLSAVNRVRDFIFFFFFLPLEKNGTTIWLFRSSRDLPSLSACEFPDPPCPSELMSCVLCVCVRVLTMQALR